MDPLQRLRPSREPQAPGSGGAAPIHLLLRECSPRSSISDDPGGDQRSRQGAKVGRHTVWKKETRDRIKVLKMGRGTQDLRGQERCSSEPHHLYLVSQLAESICGATIRSASCVPRPESHVTDDLELSLFSRAKGITLLEALNPHMPWGKHLCVCSEQYSELALT